MLKSIYPDFEIVLVDNASTDAGIALLRSRFGADDRLKIVYNTENLLFTGGYNTGIRASGGELIIALNNDTEVHPDWLTHIADAMRDTTIGAAQPAVVIWHSEPPYIEYAGAGIDKTGFAAGYNIGPLAKLPQTHVRDIFYAGGTAMILRRSALEKTGLFDGKFGMHWEDVDLSWRMHLAGFRVVLIPMAVIYHRGSLSMKKFQPQAAVVWYTRKNRIAGLIKNYSARNLLRYLPCLLALYIAGALKELIIGGNARFFISTLRAVAWNVKELPYLMRERALIQRSRRVSDAAIIRLMFRRPVFLRFLPL